MPDSFSETSMGEFYSATSTVGGPSALVSSRFEPLAGSARAARRDDVSSPSGGEKATVLVVNDVRDQLDLMKALLRRSDYRVLTALDGREGFEVAAREFPDLVISDVSMPHMDGVEMCGLIRRHPGLRWTPILLVSAICKDSASVIEGLRAGADDYLEAPYDPMCLVTKAARLIERKHVEQRLRQSEERFRAFVEHASDNITVVGPDGITIYESPSVERITGYKPEELVGGCALDGTHPDDVAKVAAVFEKGLNSEEATEPVEYRYRHKNGSWLVLESIGRSYVDEKGARVGIVNTRDITERKQAEEALRRSEEQLLQARKMEAIGQLAGGVAHDFNNLLTAINGYSDLTLRKLKKEDPLRHNIEEIKKAGERATALTRQLLAFSRRQVLQPQVINVNAVIADMTRMLPRIIGEDIDLKAALSDELGNVKADPGQIEQVILNLAINARDAMPHGGKLTIETRNVVLDEKYAESHAAITPGLYVLIAVSDTGSGMSEETRGHIFEPFFTTKEPGRGTGLGLSTVYGIVKQSSGDIWVYSEVGSGTTFKIYLPRVDAEAEDYLHQPEAQEAPRGTETILLVEDEEMLRSLTREVLEMCGYRVLAASTGAEALRICERHLEPIHLLLTDVVMPEMSGRFLAGCVLRIRTEMRVLYMSGYADEAIVHHGVLAEGTNFIQKPFTPDSLSKKVRGVLDAEQE